MKARQQQQHHHHHDEEQAPLEASTAALGGSGGSGGSGDEVPRSRHWDRHKDGGVVASPRGSNSDHKATEDEETISVHVEFGARTRMRSSGTLQAQWVVFCRMPVPDGAIHVSGFA
jgi:hypothetical protein